MDKITEAYKKLITEEEVRFMREIEFPAELKDTIKELLEIKDKCKKRKEEE